MVATAQCTLCPRRCMARPGGYCGAGNAMQVAAVCLHTGEEPPISGQRGIVNVFFAHCNLQCIYCQNHQISGRDSVAEELDAETLAERICALLPQSEGLVGFVTAAHYADRLPEVVEAIHRRGFNPAVVYNSGGYESVETLRTLEGVVDIYLPDFKYSSPTIAAEYSHAADYPQVALSALREMRRQVGEGLKTDIESGVAYRGLVVRHLVLPGEVENSLRCLDMLAEEFEPSRLHLSLMAQYYPPKANLPAELGRTINADEYSTVATHADHMGFCKGWRQELSAQRNYRPDFDQREKPFGQ